MVVLRAWGDRMKEANVTDRNDDICSRANM